MRTFALDRWKSFLSLTLCLLIATTIPGAALAGNDQAPEPSAESRDQPESSKLQRLRVAAIQDALRGDVGDGLRRLREAAGVGPRDPSTGQTLSLLKRCASLRERVEDQRAREYARVVQRINRCMLAQQNLAELSEEWRERIREMVDDASIAPLADVPSGKEYEDADAGEARELTDKALQSLSEAQDGLEKLLELTRERDGVYADELADAARAALRAIEAQQAVWKSVAAGGDEAADAWRIRETEDTVPDAMADVEAMVAEKPWRLALLQARTARTLVPHDVEMTDEAWFARLSSDVEARGRRALEQAEWDDALSAYAGLSDLDPDNEDYEETSKIAGRHVRVLRLYGSEEESDGDEGDDATEGDEAEVVDQTTWRDRVAGIDASMIEQVISRLAQSYVMAVDFREVALGGLRSVRVLAETPQVAATFEALGDPKKKERFLEIVRKTSDNIRAKDRVDQLDLQLAMNTVLLASGRTVGIPTEVLAMEFTDGFLDELDQFSSMVWPHDYEDFTKQTMGHFYGVGIQITKDPGEPLRVVTPLPGSPAYEAGIQVNDKILKVDGKSTRNRSVDKLVRMITGERGTEVVLTIEREGRLKPFDVPIIREEIRIRTVKGWRRRPDGEWRFMLDEEDGIGYLRISQFTSDTHEHMVEAIEQMKDAGMRSLVLDLRFNPGGLLRMATQVANEFIDDGTLVSTRGRQTPRKVAWANARGSFLAGDVVVLVNEYSASAAEIVSGALKDHGRATVVGMRTYGKGSVQNVIRVRMGKALLKLTTAYYYLPSGRLLHRRNGADDWGVNPNVEVDVTPKQMKRWLEIRRNTDLVREVAPDELTDKLRKQYDADIQLNMAVLLLKLMRMEDGASETASASAA